MIYIAGKITGLPLQEADDKFQKAENDLHFLGLKVINPLKLGIPHSWSWSQQIDECKRVINERAKAIYLLRDWKESKGAREEFQEVEKINRRRNRDDKIEIYYEEDHGLRMIMSDIRDGILYKCLIPESIDE